MHKILRLSSKLTLLVMLFCSAVFAQTGSVKGIVWDDEMNDAVAGANVILKGSTVGTISGADGTFQLGNIPTGSQIIVVSFIGYGSKELPVRISDGSTVELGRIKLETQSIGLEEINVIASVAIDRKTPVAVSTIKGPVIDAKYDQALNSVPSEYILPEVRVP